MTELSRRLGRRATLDDIPNSELERLAGLGFDWIWLLSVWQTGTVARTISRSHPQWRREFTETLPDLTDEDIAGSGFAITGYTVHRHLGGDAALARLRRRLRDYGLKLMLDFVPNHMAPDHPWVPLYPEFFVTGTESDLLRAPQNYFRHGEKIFAYGRDPYFAGWPDTIQLNYGNPNLQTAMIGELKRIAGQCDGVRCDMAMLVLPDIFERTWGVAAPPFWSTAIQRVRNLHPGFLFLAEVYWDMEWRLQQEGFNYCYDKRLYDRLREGHARPVREHLHADLDYQDHLARFLENHDEPRIAATLNSAQHQAAALITFLSPGLRFFHDGQFEGRLKRISPHLVRAPAEPTDEILSAFYERLLTLIRRPTVRDGRWWLLECRPAWEGNWTYDGCIAFAWERSNHERLVVVVNYSDHHSQARLPLPFDNLASEIRFEEQITSGTFDRHRDDLAANGLYVDLPPWGSHVCTVSAVQ